MDGNTLVHGNAEIPRKKKKAICGAQESDEWRGGSGGKNNAKSSKAIDDAYGIGVRGEGEFG